MSTLDATIEWFEALDAESVRRIGEFYAADAYFKDPFNEVRGIAAVQRIFEHMFEQVVDPRFRITDRVAATNGALLTWDFMFGLKPGGRRIIVRGATHLRFNPAGRISFHRDYWDTSEELYAKLPLIGVLMRALRRRASATGS